jgi:hypothetical protein
MIPFENRTDIVRDPHSKAILSRDKAAFIEAKKKKEQQERYINLEKQVFEMKNETAEIKKLLLELLNRGTR